MDIPLELFHEFHVEFLSILLLTFAFSTFPIVQNPLGKPPVIGRKVLRIFVPVTSGHFKEQT